jgi:Flp pilus assembly protein TadG
MMQTRLAKSILFRAAARAVERLRDDRGIAAVEFALIFPLMLSFMFGMAAVTEQVQAVHKVELVANTLADLAASKTTGGDGLGQAAITDADLSDIFKAAEFLISPLPKDKLKLDIYQIAISGTTSRTSPYQANVVWWANQNGAALLACADNLKAGTDGNPDEISGLLLAIPQNSTVAAGRRRYLILTHVSYDYTPPFGLGQFRWSSPSTTRIFRAAYAQVRNLWGLGLIQDKASSATTCNYAVN